MRAVSKTKSGIRGDHPFGECGYWDFWYTPAQALVVAQRTHEGPWLTSPTLRADTPIPMKYYKVSPGLPGKKVGCNLISSDLFAALDDLTNGQIQSVPAVIETVKGTEVWPDYRFIKVNHQIAYDDMRAGKGREAIYSVVVDNTSIPWVVVSTCVRDGIRSIFGDQFSFCIPMVVGSKTP